MSSALPEKLLMKRLQLQINSLESPSELPGTRGKMDPGVSPMTDLAMNLNDTSLGLTPVQDSKRRLSLGSESSDSSTPSPKEKMTGSEATPLTSLTNKPKRLLVGSGRRGFSSLLVDSQENKENIPCRDSLSPKKRSMSKLAASPNGKPIQKFHSPGKIFSRLNSPGKIPSPTISPGKRLFGRKPSPLKERNVIEKPSPEKRLLTKRPMFQVLEDEIDDTNSRDSGYNSQNLDDLLNLRAQCSPIKGDMNEILQNCSPDKEDGITPLKSSPERAEKEPLSDGFDFVSLETISEDQENESPRFDLKSLLSNKMYLPEQTKQSEKEAQSNGSEVAIAKPLPERKLSLGSRIGFRRPTFRRAMSMIDRPMESEFDSPVSRNAEYGLLPSFKRPEPPRDEDQDNASKRRKFEASSLESKESGERRKPKFYRSHSENELSIMKSCHRLYEVENILPDGSRTYALPALEGGNKHPSLRSISCETLAMLIRGKFNHIINSFRIIDARYKFEFDGGHIMGAENWQHGEEEEFLNAFLPSTPLPVPPPFDPNNQKKRDILVFHCEFSSQRGPDFYMKLRKRDRDLNEHTYPGLHYPECYLLHLGYKEFFQSYPDLCHGNYTAMADPKHENDLRKMRAKSKSWSGGTIMRTGKSSRLHL